jgi:hypothetical protein
MKSSETSDWFKNCLAAQHTCHPITCFSDCSNRHTITVHKYHNQHSDEDNYKHHTIATPHTQTHLSNTDTKCRLPVSTR